MQRKCQREGKGQLCASRVFSPNKEILQMNRLEDCTRPRAAGVGSARRDDEELPLELPGRLHGSACDDDVDNGGGDSESAHPRQQTPAKGTHDKIIIIKKAAHLEVRRREDLGRARSESPGSW
mgnify:CR=1 FL=1